MTNETNTTRATTADAGGSAETAESTAITVSTGLTESAAAGLTANRTYKSTMFIMLFEDKNNLLELYNAISGKNYTDPGMLEINTLENAIYMTMKNDISFLIDGRLSLYEHQSTDNPNLPLWFLFYISKLYSGMTRNENLYGTRIVQIPPPEFIIFYNGRDELPDRMERKISDMYTVRDPHAGLELKAVMLNIAGKHKQKLKEACRTLREYAIYTDKVRRYVEEMERAIQECISEGVLKDFLEKHRAEAKEMSIFEYDQEKHMKQEREAAWEEGHREGFNSGIMLTKQVLQLSARGKSIEDIARECSISPEQVREILE